MYLILSDADGNVTSSRASKVFHDGVDVTGLRVAEEEKVRQRREGLSEKRRSVGEEVARNKATGKENTAKT